MPYCTNCGSKVDEAANFCRECGCNLKLDDNTIQAQPPDSSTVKKCAIHPKMNASGVCCECGAGVCVICKSGLGDKLYCPSCAGNDIQAPGKATDEPVKDKKIQRELDWLQDFEKQYEEVIGLVAEMRDTAKRLPSTSQESDKQVSSDLFDQFQELQRKFISIEKSLNSGRKPKSSDLQKMNLRLKGACINYGIACVGYRKWVERPSSSVEKYTNEKLEKAGKAIDEVNEQLTQFSNKSEYMQRAMTSNDSRKVILGLEQASQTTEITDDVFTNTSLLRIMRGSGFIRKEGAKSIIFGFLMLIVGGIVTYFTYRAASGGGLYIVTYGLFIGGLTAIIKGLYHLLRG